MLITLVSDRPEARIVDTVLHSVEVRVIENVRRIEPDLNLLALRKPEVLAQRTVERPGARPCDGSLSKSPPLARLGILEKNPSRGVGDGGHRACCF